MKAIAVFVSAPLLIGMIFHFRTHVPPWAHWLMNKTLQGTQIEQSLVPFSGSTLFNAKYQAELAADFNENFAGRELLIRITNEIYFRLFKASPMPSADLTVERNDALIETVYLREYCLERISSAQLEPVVGNIKRLQDECERRGIGFVLLITPSKASICPEDIPARWMKRYNPRSRAYDLFVPLLRQQGIHYVDGHAIAMQTKDHALAPVFPRGGIHWGEQTALATANEVIGVLKTEGKKLQPIDARFQISDVPLGEDGDLLGLMNLSFPWHYPVIHLEYKPSVTRGNYNMVIVGGSFMWSTGRILGNSRQFSEIDCYYYYKTSKKLFVDGNLLDVSSPVQTVDFDSEIFAADCLVVEVNEQMLAQPVNNLTTFIPDALEHVPAPGKAMPPFHSEKPAAQAAPR